MSHGDSRQSGAKAKRDALSPSTPDNEKNKRYCINQKLQRIAEEPLFDKEEILERVMALVNDTFKTSVKSVDLEEANSDGDTGKLLAKMMTPLVTAIASAITTSFAEIVDKAVTRINQKDAMSNNSCQDALVTMRSLTYENDSLEQYTRRENIRIFGIEQERGETPESVEAKALKVINATGANVSSNDIAACHRVGRPKNGKHPIKNRSYEKEEEPKRQARPEREVYLR